MGASNVAAKEKAFTTSLACSDACALLTLFLQYPTIELAEGLNGGSVQADVFSIGLELGCDAKVMRETASSFADHSHANPGALKNELRREHTRLFDHPVLPQVPYYEELFLFSCDHPGVPAKEGPLRFVNKAAVSAEAAYREGGFGVVRENSVPADCITLELAFLGKMYTCASECMQSGDCKRLAEVQAIIREFEQGHVERWIPEFFWRLGNESKGFYGYVGRVGVLYMERILALYPILSI
ncbi:molecular chaperone TorD family protein [Adlercreutzia sp. R7]|uniref:Molecular chaperone TorD family protein n=1 Tax=Adlercreutzia wanghongyangiae TaxID=3111451 RepID=A0ABU6IK11_9ACTN|nr:molecular chaperone TorD family protein [Adlercreutzia sp. R7]